MEERNYTFGHESSVAHYGNMENVKAEGYRGLKYDLEYDIWLYFEYILNLEGHTLKNSFMSDFTLYFALATGRIATAQSINQS